MDYCNVFLSCLGSHSDGTHSLQRIDWWASDAMLHFSKSVRMKKKNSSTYWMAWGWVYLKKILFFMKPSNNNVRVSLMTIKTRIVHKKIPICVMIYKHNRTMTYVKMLVDLDQWCWTYFIIYAGYIWKHFTTAVTATQPNIKGWCMI